MNSCTWNDFGDGSPKQSPNTHGVAGIAAHVPLTVDPKFRFPSVVVPLTLANSSVVAPQIVE